MTRAIKNHKNLDSTYYRIASGAFAYIIRAFERKVLRKIYGPGNFGNGECRWRTNEELLHLSEGEDAVKFVMAQRLPWLGHVVRMSWDRPQKLILN